jgi:hypothetical protein
MGVDGDKVKIRYHFNFCEAALGTTERDLVHNLHSDSARCLTDEDETKTERAVAAVTIRASKEQMIAFQKMITDNKDKVPVKTGDESYDFEAVVGKAISAPSLYISTPAQNGIAKRINAAFLTSIKEAGYLLPEEDDVENDPEDTTCLPSTELMSGASGTQATGQQKRKYLASEVDDEENDLEVPTCLPCSELMPGASGMQAMETQAIKKRATCKFKFCNELPVAGNYGYCSDHRAKKPKVALDKSAAAACYRLMKNRN